MYNEHWSARNSRVGNSLAFPRCSRSAFQVAQRKVWNSKAGSQLARAMWLRPSSAMVVCNPTQRPFNAARAEANRWDYRVRVTASRDCRTILHSIVRSIYPTHDTKSAERILAFSVFAFLGVDFLKLKDICNGRVLFYTICVLTFVFLKHLVNLNVVCPLVCWNTFDPYAYGKGSTYIYI